jgi:hypothetical protein
VSLRRTLGRALISAAAIQTAVVPFLADWNETHVFSDQWSPHARFHGFVSLGMNATLAPVALWMVWRRRSEPGAATLISIAYSGWFFGAALVPHTDVEDPGHPVPRVAGIPANMVAATTGVSMAALGWCLG